jgi:hypothetical protein
MGHPSSKAKLKGKVERQKAQLLKTKEASGGLLRGALLGRALALLGDFGELAGFYVVDEAAHGDVAHIGVVFDAGDLAADILLKVLEGVEVRRRYD